MTIGDQIPRYLLDKRQVSTTVVYTALFSLVFILLSTPFAEDSWFALGTDRAFSYTLLFMLLAALLVVLSRVLMYRGRTLLRFSWAGYILWVAAEIVVLSGGRPWRMTTRRKPGR